MKKIVSFSLFIILILSSCNLPTATTAPPPTQANPKDLIASMVAATVIAQPISTLVQTQAVQVQATSTPTRAAPTPTGTPELTATPGLTETSAPVTSPTSTASNDFTSSLGPPTWKDTFTTSNGFFQKGTNSYEDDHTRIAIENGLMTLTSFGTPPNWVGWRLTYPTVKNFYLETSFVTHNCSGGDRYGMVFRSPDFESGFGFYLAFTCDGRYRLERMDEAGLAYVTPWSASGDLLAGAEQNNRMGVLASDSTYSIYINGVKQIEVNDGHFQEAGHFGPFIAYAQSPNFSIDLKSIAYWIMP